MKVCFDTFGCRLNRAEALEEEARYVAAGYEVVNKHSAADVIVIRGCSVTARAQRDCEKLILSVRRRYPLKTVVVQGCVKDLNLPGRKKRPPPVIPETDAVPLRTARAYLKVQDGCNGKCSFCIVPRFRGKSRSVDRDAVLDRAKRFIDAGYHEIVVTGCNLALYASRGMRLSELVVDLAELSPDCRIRVGSVEPGPSAKELVDAIRSSHNICRFLHLPIQSGSQEILDRMHRPYRIEDVENLVDYAARKIPNIGIGCDLMTGFPGETDADFDATCDLLEEHSFTNAHVFPYSERPGTAAALALDPVPREVRSDRAHELADVIEEKRYDYVENFIGKTVEFVVENEKDRSGWSSEYVWCEATMACRKELSRRTIQKMRVVEAEEDRLIGVAI